MARIVVLSDTHGMHRSVKVPEGDILIHCGDFTGHGTVEEADAFAQWMAAQPCAHKVAVPGNHDTCTDPHHRLGSVEKARATEAAFRRHGVTLLVGAAMKIHGLKIYGSPVTPEFCGWAHMLERGLPLQQHWRRIPDDTDILVTHGPPYGKGDLAPIGGRVGCEALLERVLRVKPFLHCFGHIHEGHGAGRLWVDGVGDEVGPDEGWWCNAAVLDGQYRLAHKPQVLEVEAKAKGVKA